MIYSKLKSFCIVPRNSYRYYCVSREARFLQKLIDKGKSGSMRHMPKATTKSGHSSFTLTSVPSRRNNVLNQVCMDHVQDLINTGLYSKEFNKYGISITQCKISKTLKVLFVYWTHSKTISEGNTEEVNELLANFGNHLANVLSSFTVISRPPMVRLTKDFDLMEEERIKKILKALPLANEKEKEKEIDKEKPQFQMQNNVLGLDYCKILQRIIEARAGFDRYVKPQIQLNTSEESITRESNFDKKKLGKTIFKRRREIKNQIEDMTEEYF